jgi:N-acetylmuramoyl-L-alanine amidase
MGGDPKLKKRLLAQAVQENLDVIQGVRRSASRTRRLRKGWIAATALAAVASAIGVWRMTADGSSPSAVEASRMRAVEAILAPSALGPAPPAGVAPRSESPPRPGEITPEIFPLAVRRVVIDPGHGGTTEGAMSAARHGARLREKELALDIAQRTANLLGAAGFEVLLTRERDANIDLKARAEFANRAAGDLFLSIHLNWIEGRRGVETYYLGAAADASLQQLAASENGESGYSMSDMRRLLDGVYSHLRGAESRVLAESVQLELHKALRRVTPELRDRGVKTAPFVVLINTEMPAVLAEVSDLADEREVALLRTAEYRERIAGALAAGVRRYAESVSTTRQKGDAG